MSDAGWTAVIDLEVREKGADIIGRMKGNLTALAGELLALAGVSLGVGGWIKAGLEFNQIIAASRVSIGALLGTFNTYTDAVGNALAPTQQFTAALDDAVGVQEQLKSAALATGGTYTDLLGIFQSVLPAAQAAGAKSTDQIIQITQATSLLASTMRMSFESAGTQMQMVLSGMITRRSEIGRLMLSLGVTPEVMASWKAQGIAVEELMKKLKPFADLAPTIQKSWSASLTNMKDAFEHAAGASTKGLFNALKEKMQEVTGALIDITKEGPKLKSGLEDAMKGIDIGLTAALEGVWSVLKDMGKTVADSAGIWKSSVIAAWGSMGVELEQNEVSWKNVVLGFSLAFVNVIQWIRTAWAVAWEAMKHPISSLSMVVGEVIAWILDKVAGLIEGLGLTSWGAKIRGLAAEWSQAAKDTGKDYTDAANKAAAAIESDSDRIRNKLLDIAAASDHVSEAFKKPKPPPVDENVVKAIEKARQELDKLAVALQPAGLIGYSKAVAEVQKKYDDVGLALKKITAELTKEHALTSELKKRIDDLTASYKAAEAIELGQAEIERLKKYDEALTAIDSKVKDSALARINAEHETTLKFLRDKELEATANAKTYDEILRAVVTTNAAIERADEQRRLKEQLVLAQEGRDWTSYFAAKVEQLKAFGASVSEAIQKSAAETAGLAYAAADTAAEGVKAGLLKILAETKTQGQAVADFIVGLWNTIGQGFSTAVYDVITGKFSSLKDALKGIWEGIAKGFADLVSNMVMNWIKGQLTMKSASAALGGGGGGGGFLGGGNGDMTWGGVAGGTLVGAGIGYGVGSASGAPGWQTGATVGGTLGGAIGSIFPVIGTAIGAIVGAIIGGIIGVLSATNTEIHTYFDQANLSIKGGTAGSVMGISVLRTIQAIEAGLMGLAGTAGLKGDELSAFRTSMNSMVRKYIENMRYEVHAGSAEDVQKDIQLLLSGVIPRDLLHQMFGQVRKGYADIPGITGGGTWEWGPPGTTGWGGPSEKPMDAPIFNLLTTLGFTSDKIKEIANQIDASDPAKFLDWLNALIGVVAGFNTQAQQWGQSADELRAVIEKQAGQTPLDLLTQSAKDLTDQAKQLDLYTGDDQIRRAQALLQASQQRYQMELQYLAQIQALAKGIAQSIKSQQTGIMLDMFSPTAKADYYMSQIQLLKQQLLSATDPAAIKDIVALIQQYVASLWQLGQQPGGLPANAQWGYTPIGTTPEFGNWLQSFLEDINTIAQGKLKAAFQAVVDTNAGLDKVMKDATKLFTDVNGNVLQFADDLDHTGGQLVILETQAQGAAMALGRLAAWADKVSGTSMGGGSIPLPGGGGEPVGGDLGVRAALTIMRQKGRSMKTLTAH